MMRLEVGEKKLTWDLESYEENLLSSACGRELTTGEVLWGIDCQMNHMSLQTPTSMIGFYRLLNICVFPKINRIKTHLL